MSEALAPPARWGDQELAQVTCSGLSGAASTQEGEATSHDQGLNIACLSSPVVILGVPVAFVPVVPARGEVEIGYCDFPTPFQRQEDPD